MFNFRIIETADGNQIIDETLKTPYNALTPFQMLEYVEVDHTLAEMEIHEIRKEKERIKKEKENKKTRKKEKIKKMLFTAFSFMLQCATMKNK